MNDNKIVAFLEKNGGTIIGILIGLIVLETKVLREFFEFIIILGACGWIGNFIHKNKNKVKEKLKSWIDKM